MRRLPWTAGKHWGWCIRSTIDPPGRRTTHCYLQDLFVAADARGRGIGRALIEHVYADAKRRGASRVYWLTHETNHAAMQLYDRIADRSPFIQYRKQFACHAGW